MSEVNVDFKQRRKVQIIFVAVVIVGIIIIANLSSSKPTFSIQGVKLGDSVDKIEKKLGIAQEKFSGMRYRYNGIEFNADDYGKINTIRVMSREYRTKDGMGVGNTLAQLVDEYGKENLKMTYGDVIVRVKDSQIIKFDMSAYDSSDLYDWTEVNSMEIIDLGDRFQEKWDSWRPLEYQIE